MTFSELNLDNFEVKCKYQGHAYGGDTIFFHINAAHYFLSLD